MDSKEIYKSKLVSAEEAIGHINSGDRIVTSFGCCEPLGIERALAENYMNYNDVQITNMLIIGDTP